MDDHPPFYSNIQGCEVPQYFQLQSMTDLGVYFFLFRTSDRRNNTNLITVIDGLYSSL